MIFGYGFVNLSDRSLKENVRAIPAEELQRTFDAVEPQIFDRIGGGKDQVGFIAQDVQASGPLGETRCKVKNLDGRELMALALDYQKLPASSSRSPGESSRIGGTSRPEHERAEQARTGGHGRVDLGNEFRGAARQKDPRPERHGGGDRAIQTLKKDLTGKVARHGGGWGDHVDEVAEAYTTPGRTRRSRWPSTGPRRLGRRVEARPARAPRERGTADPVRGATGRTAAARFQPGTGDPALSQAASA